MPTKRNPTAIYPALLGRGAQVAELTALLEEARAGRGHVALISGEAGIGKSRLVAEVAAFAEGRGARSLRGRCFDRDRGLPFAPLADALRACCAAAPAGLPHELGPSAAELVKLSPELAAALPNIAATPPLEPEHEKRRLFQALTQLARRLATAERPLLLVLEDLHWCDDSSLEWLLAFSRELAGLPLLALLTYRDDEAHPRLGQLLAALDRLPQARELALPRLEPADTAAMARAIVALPEPPPADFLARLHALTDGNPLFVEELLKSLLAAGELGREGDAWAGLRLSDQHIPRSVQVAVRQRTRGLGAAAREALTLAAVIGQRFDFGVMQAVTGHAEAELLGLVRELAEAQLVREEADDRFAFRHALTRQAVYAGLPAGGRNDLHRAVAEALERRHAGALDAHAGELAYHCEEAGLWEPALAWASRAAERAAGLYAYGEALSHYARARACAERLGRPDQLAAIDQAVGRAHDARGDFPQALASYQRALGATADPARRAVLMAEIGAAYVNSSDERGPAHLHAALAALSPETQAREVATALLWLGRHRIYLVQYSEAIGYLERARQISEPLGDLATLRHVYGFLASALMLSGRFDEGMTWARRCVDIGEARGDPSAAAVGYLFASESARYMGRWREMDAFAERGLQSARLAGWLYREAWNLLQRAKAAYHRGDLCAAAAAARECASLAAELGERRLIIRSRETLGIIEAALGHEQAAHELCEAAMRDAEPLTELTARCWGRVAMGMLAMQREEWAEAGALYGRCAELVAGTQIRVYQMEVGGLLAEARCAQGRPDEAARLAAETLAEALATGARHYEAVAWRALGRALAAQGKHEEAERAFDSAVALCEALGSRLELAHTLYHRGAMLRAQGRPSLAHAELVRARDLCAEMGAAGLLWRAHAALGQLALEGYDTAAAEQAFAAAAGAVESLAAAMDDGAFRAHLRRRAAQHIPDVLPEAPRRAVKARFGGLTGRERAVAALIAAGRSNREIAEALVISERTETTHVSNIFVKLGFSSRAQVAAWAREQGLEPA